MSKQNKKTPAVDKTAGVNPEESRFAEAKSNETPAVETPVVETPVVETPAVETPIVETPAVETPVVETPAIETPVVETLNVETPAVETPVVETPNVETPAVETPVVETHTMKGIQKFIDSNTVETHDAKLIPSGRFIAENGNEFEFAVSEFTFQGKTYTKEEALSDHTDVLEHLISVKSFILKKV